MGIQIEIVFLFLQENMFIVVEKYQFFLVEKLSV